VPLIDYMPKAALAALVIALSFSLFNLRHIRICLRSTRDDATVLIITFMAALLAPLYVAIFIGVAISISCSCARPAGRTWWNTSSANKASCAKWARNANARFPRSRSSTSRATCFSARPSCSAPDPAHGSDPAIQVIILRLKNARHLDATSVMALEDLIRFMRGKGLHLIVSGASRDVYRVLKKSGVLLTLQEGCDRRAGESNLFLTNPRNPNLSTRGALKRAQQLLGTDKADIRIFYDPRPRLPSK
jgi:sulfate permease, SulP family